MCTAGWCKCARGSCCGVAGAHRSKESESPPVPDANIRRPRRPDPQRGGHWSRPRTVYPSFEAPCQTVRRPTHPGSKSRLSKDRGYPWAAERPPLSRPRSGPPHGRGAALLVSWQRSGPPRSRSATCYTLAFRWSGKTHFVRSHMIWSHGVSSHCGGDLWPQYGATATATATATASPRGECARSAPGREECARSAPG